MGLSALQLSRVKELRQDMLVNAALGRYKGYKAAKKEYVSLAIQDFQAITKIKTKPISVPLFSKSGLNLLYIRIREAFSIKTEDEKKFKKMAEEEVIRRKLNIET